jgi:predicted SnoaL-like aldol condensation-catalyzing enzyme
MSPFRMSKIESAIRVAIDFNEAFNRHDVPGMIQLVSDDCIFEHFHPAPDGSACLGKEAASQFWRDFFYESPQAHIDIEDVYSFGDRCIMRWRYDWVDEEEVNRHVRGVDIFRVKDGSICEKLSYAKG